MTPEQAATATFYLTGLCLVLLALCAFAGWAENTRSGDRFVRWLERWF